MQRKLKKQSKHFFLFIILLLLLTTPAYCVAEGQNPYYRVIYTDILATSPHLGPAWADWITSSILYLCAKHQVNPLLVTALFKQESRFNMASLSPTGAIGIAQLQPETAAALGVDPYDPAQNIEGGIRYLAQQLQAFRHAGEWQASYAIAAYNAGPGAVTKHGGIPPYRETIHHVNQIGTIYKQLAAAL